MNRTLILGIASFIAVVGIALVGGEKTAVAARGCNGCSCGGAEDCGGGCHARKHRSRGCHARCNGDCKGGCHARKHRRCHGCNGGCNGGCDGGAAPAAPEAAPAAPGTPTAPPAPSDKPA